MQTTVSLILMLMLYVSIVRASYQCLCNQNTTAPVPLYAQMTDDSNVSDHLFYDQCLPTLPLSTLQSNWLAVVLNKMVLYIKEDNLVTEKVCSGDILLQLNLVTQPPGTFNTTDETTEGPTISTNPMTSSTSQTVQTSTAKITPTTAPHSPTLFTVASTTQTFKSTEVSTSTPTTMIYSKTTSESTTSAHETTKHHTNHVTTQAPGESNGCPGRIQELAQTNNSVLTTFRGKCYQLVIPGTHYWNQARRTCAENNGLLVTIDSSDIQIFLNTFVTSHTDKSFWIGLNDAKHEGQLQWVSGETVSFQHFSAHSSNTDGHDCVRMHKNGLWTISACDSSDRHPYICEYDLLAHSGSSLIVGR